MLLKVELFYMFKIKLQLFVFLTALFLNLSSILRTEQKLNSTVFERKKYSQLFKYYEKL